MLIILVFSVFPADTNMTDVNEPDAGNNDFERGGTAAAWAREFGLPLREVQEQLRNAIGIPVVQGDGEPTMGYTESEARRLLADLILMKHPERDRVIEAIKVAYPNPTDLIQLNYSAVRKTGFKHWRDLGNFFGISEDPFGCYEARLRLAAIAFGEDNPEIKWRLEEQNELARNINEPLGPSIEIWRQQIMKQYPTSDEFLRAERVFPAQNKWLEMHASDDRSAYHAMEKLCSRLGIKPAALDSDHETRIKIGFVVYGDQDIHLLHTNRELCERTIAEQKYLDELGQDPHKWRDALLQRFATVQIWYEKTEYLRRSSLISRNPEVTEEDLAKLGKIFTINISQKRQKVVHDLAICIFGQSAVVDFDRKLDQEREQTHNEELKRALTGRRSELTGLVKKKVPHVQQWVCMSYKRRQSFRVKNDMDLDLIAQEFGILASPIASLFHHFELGKGIYGKDDPVILTSLKALEEGQIVQYLHKMVSTNIDPENSSPISAQTTIDENPTSPR